MLQTTTSEYPKVIFIGGAPMLGKTTVARRIAQRLDYNCIATDDIGAAICSVTKPETHPAFHYMGDKDYRDYYVLRSPSGLIQDIDRQHEALWPALRTLFDTHSTWSTPAVIEGWALRPSYVAGLRGKVSGVFLLGAAELIEQRAHRSRFSEGASDPLLMIQRYIERSLWYNSRVAAETDLHGLKTFQVTPEMRTDAIATKVLTLVSR